MLCDKKGTSEKKKLSHDDCDLGGIRASCLEKTVWNPPRATPPLTCGRNHPVKDLMNEPVVPKANERYFNSRLFNLTRAQKPCFYVLPERGCRLPLPSEAAEVFWCRSSSRDKPNLRDTGWETNQLLAWGFCVSCPMEFCNRTPCKSGEQVLQIQLEGFHPRLKIRELSFLSWRLWGWKAWLDYLVGSWASFGFPRETVRWDLPSASLSSSTTRRHLLDFPPSLCTGIGPCLSLVHSAALAISLPVCSCSSSTLLFLSLVIGLVSLSRRFHSVVLRL